MPTSSRMNPRSSVHSTRARVWSTPHRSPAKARPDVTPRPVGPALMNLHRADPLNQGGPAEKHPWTSADQQEPAQTSKKKILRPAPGRPSPLFRVLRPFLFNRQPHAAIHPK